MLIDTGYVKTANNLGGEVEDNVIDLYLPIAENDIKRRVGSTVYAAEEVSATPSPELKMAVAKQTYLRMLAALNNTPNSNGGIHMTARLNSENGTTSIRYATPAELGQMKKQLQDEIDSLLNDGGFIDAVTLGGYIASEIATAEDEAGDLKIAENPWVPEVFTEE